MPWLRSAFIISPISGPSLTAQRRELVVSFNYFQSLIEERASARKALEIDPSLPDAISMLAYHAGFFDYEPGRRLTRSAASSNMMRISASRGTFSRFLSLISGSTPKGFLLLKEHWSSCPGMRPREACLLGFSLSLEIRIAPQQHWRNWGHGKAYADPAGFMFHSLIIGNIEEVDDYRPALVNRPNPPSPKTP